MNKVSMVKSISELIHIGFENVIFRDMENNYYEDSNFCYVGVNVRTGKYFKHVHSTTRFGGYDHLEKSVDFKDLPEEIQKEVSEIFKNSTLEQAKEYITNRGEIMCGDVVQVTNARARKHKMVMFTVNNISSYRDYYGRCRTVYLHGKDEHGEEVKTAMTNCQIVHIGDSHLHKVAERFSIGSL